MRLLAFKFFKIKITGLLTICCFLAASLGLQTGQAQDSEIKLRQQFFANVMKAPSDGSLKILLQNYLAKKDSFSNLIGDLPLWHCSKNCLYFNTSEPGLVLMESKPASIKEIRP